MTAAGSGTFGLSKKGKRGKATKRCSGGGGNSLLRSQRAFEAALFAALLVMFLVQVKDQVYKYLEGSTSHSVSKVRDAEIEYPLVTFCASDAFKKGDGVDIRAFIYPSNETLTEEQARSFWELYENHTFKRMEDFMLIAGVNASSSFSFEEVNTLYQGKCHTADISEPVKRADYMSAYLRKTDVDVTVTIHPRSLRSNLVNDFWPSSVSFFDIVPSNFHIFDITKHVYEHLNLANDPCEGDPDYSRDACVVAKTREWLFDHGCQPMDMKETEHGPKKRPCLIPQAKYFVTEEDMRNLENCSDAFEVQCSLGAVYYGYVNASISCVRECTETIYEIIERRTKSTLNVTTVALFYSSTSVILHREYELYDFGTIVGIVGGSLGLFLGFSCLQFGNWVVARAFGALGRKGY